MEGLFRSLIRQHHCHDPDCLLSPDAPFWSPCRLLYGARWWLYWVVWFGDEMTYPSLWWHLRFYQRRHARDHWKRRALAYRTNGYTSGMYGTSVEVCSQKEEEPHMSISESVTSSEHIVLIPHEPAATFEVVERAMIGTAGLLTAMLRSPHMTPELLHDWGSLMESYRRDLQTSALRLKRETMESEAQP